MVHLRRNKNQQSIEEYNQLDAKHYDVLNLLHLSFEIYKYHGFDIWVGQNTKSLEFQVTKGINRKHKETPSQLM